MLTPSTVLSATTISASATQAGIRCKLMVSLARRQDIAGRDGDRRDNFANLRLLAQAQRRARHFHARTGVAKDVVAAFNSISSPMSIWRIR